MPLNVRRFNTSVLLVLFSFVIFAGAQTVPTQTASVPTASPVAPPTSGDVMRERISKSKGYIAVRNYNAAIYELENIRRETADTAVQGVVNVLLMNSYLEQGDFKRAQDFLAEFYNAQKTNKPNSSPLYMAVAGQVIKGARNRVERYRALGLSVGDRTLPLEASNDLEKMRETLELVITQSKEVAKDQKKSADAMMMVEEASASRSQIARDDYDARRWKDNVADAREELANSRSVVTSAITEGPATTAPVGDLVATKQTTPPQSTPVNQPVMQPVMQPVSDTTATRDREVKPADTTVAKNDKPIVVTSAPPTVKETPKQEEPKTEKVEPATVKTEGPLDVGSLIAYATRQTPPVYPPAAKSMRTTGVVKVEVTVNENGEVAEVQKTSGPTMLQAAAKDAIRKWKFKPFVRDGLPVKATGFVSFNFNL